jgi:hypothetical protein
MKNKAINTVVFCLIFLSSFNGIAQDGPGTEDSSGTPGNLENADPATPINDYIVPMLLLGVVIGFILQKKNTNVAS